MNLWNYVYERALDVLILLCAVLAVVGVIAGLGALFIFIWSEDPVFLKIAATGFGVAFITYQIVSAA